MKLEETLELARCYGCRKLVRIDGEPDGKGCPSCGANHFVQPVKIDTIGFWEMMTIRRWYYGLKVRGWFTPEPKANEYRPSGDIDA